MRETIDGDLTLAEQESCIQFKEAKGYRLRTLTAGVDDPPTNEAEFDKLPIGQLVDLIRLCVGSVPVDEEEVWNGTIYVEGEKKVVSAYRVPE